MPAQSQAFDTSIFSLEFRSAVPPYARIDQFDLDSQITSCVLSTVLPGGYQTCQIGYDQYAIKADGEEMRFGAIPTNTITAPHFGLLRVKADAHNIFDGRIVRRDIGLDGVKALQAKGFAMTATADHTFSAPNDSTEYSATDVIRIVLGQCANNLIVPGPPDKWVDPGIGAFSLSEFQRRQAGQIIDQLSRMGNTYLWDFNVWDAAEVTQPVIAGIAEFIPRKAPTTPNYQISWDSSISNWSEISEDAYNTVQASYTNANTGAINQLSQKYTDTSLYDLYGINRSITVDAGTCSQAYAEAFAQTYLAGHKLPSVQCTVTRTQFRGLELYGGGPPSPPYLVRAGEWIKIANYPQILPIVRTEYNASTGELTLEVGALAPSYGSLIHELHRAHCATAGGSNLNSGARA